VSCVLLMLPGRRKAIRVCGAAVLLTYCVYAIFVLLVWVT